MKQSKASHLKLVKSFNEADYPYPLTIEIDFNPDKDPADRVCRFVPDYKKRKIKTAQNLFTAQIHQTMSNRLKDDYYIEPTPQGLDARFKYKEDRDKAVEDMNYVALSNMRLEDLLEKEAPESQPAAETKILSPRRLTTDDFKCVSTFSSQEYPYPFRDTFKNPYDSICRYETITPIKTAINSARIDDYKLLETFHGIELHLKTYEDSMLFQMAVQGEREIELAFLHAAPDSDIRKLRRECRSLKKFARNMGFGYDIAFEVDPSEKKIILFASGKSPCFQFYQVARQTGLLEKYKQHPPQLTKTRQITPSNFSKT